VIGHNLWQLRFGGDPRIVGLGIRINGQPLEVIGVAQPGFVGASPTTAMAEIWIPTTAPARIAPELAASAERRSANFSVIGRLAGGVSYAQAEQALEPVVRQLEQIHNDPNKDSKERRVRLLPGGRMFPVRDEDLPRAMGFPFLLVALVLLMACGNVANLLLARSVPRRREMAVRLSPGAGPGRIVRQLVTESMLLSLIGAVGGVVLAIWFTSVIGSTRPMLPSYVHFETRLDWRSLLMAALIAAGSSFVFGLIPALRSSRTNVHAGLTSRSASGAGGRRWFNMRNVLVFQQVAVSTVLLLLTGFVVVGWQRSAGVELGFEPANLYLVNLDPVRDGYSPVRRRNFSGSCLRGWATSPA
jgi:putative ABC transport system permease protein